MRTVYQGAAAQHRQARSASEGGSPLPRSRFGLRRFASGDESGTLRLAVEAFPGEAPEVPRQNGIDEQPDEEGLARRGVGPARGAARLRQAINPRRGERPSPAERARDHRRDTDEQQHGDPNEPGPGGTPQRDRQEQPQAGDEREMNAARDS